MTELWFLHSALAICQCTKFHLIPFYTLRDMLRTSLLLQKLRSNTINSGDRVMVLAFCDSPYSPLSVYQVSFIYLQYFQRYDKLTIAKIRKGNNSVITCDRVMHCALSLMAVYQLCIKFHLIPFYTFRNMLRTSFLLQN